MVDKISNIINILKNAGNVEKESILVPFSNFSWAILKLLNKHNFVGDVSKKGKGKSVIEVVVLYNVNGTPKISGVKRLSKSSRRVYLSANELRPVQSGFGKLIISTPSGVMTGEDAKKKKVGGEPLFNIW